MMVDDVTSCLVGKRWDEEVLVAEKIQPKAKLRQMQSSEL